MPPRFANALLVMMPNAKLISAYGGGSEGVPANLTTVYDPARPTLMGRPVPGTELSVVDPTGTQLPPGQVGEVLLRTAAPKRYYLDPRLNKRLHTADGFVRTGDLGYVDEGGELYFFDRSADAIHAGGELVSSIEIENAIFEHPAVREAAVVGVGRASEGERQQFGPGERIVAAAVLVDPAAGPDAAALKEYVARRLPAHKVPVTIHIVDALPRGRMSHKVLKRVLRERFSQ
jgi:acyl-CoA synthetase (AMP-forming)/AMP-acid ligase II